MRVDRDGLYSMRETRIHRILQKSAYPTQSFEFWPFPRVYLMRRLVK